MSWELGGQQLTWTENRQHLKPCLYPYPGSCPRPGEPQLFLLGQYLGENLLGLPQEQEGLDLLQGLQTLGLVALGEESQNLGALGCQNRSICSQVILGWNQQGPQRHQGLYPK